MDAERVSDSDVKMGSALPWNVVDEKGMLLLKKGAVITTERQRNMLVSRGLFFKNEGAGSGIIDDRKPKEVAFDPFDIIEHSAFRLSNLLYKLTQHENVLTSAKNIALKIMVTCTKDPDATLGAVHLLHGHAYTTIHPIHTAVLSHSLCMALKLSPAETETIVIAALTSNIGMLELQEILHDQKEPLSDTQKQQIAAHPHESVNILKASGFDNQNLLDIVLQHHERSNGGGYPNGLKCEEISQGAKILALADVYSAMISPRGYQDSKQASNALKTLFLERGKEYDETLSVVFIKHMGVFPPGSFVKLANGEIAVIVRRTADSMHPEIASVANPKGIPYSRPLARDSKDPENAIKGMVEFERLNMNISSIWGYN